MKKILSTLTAIVMLAGCGNAAAAVQESAESISSTEVAAPAVSADDTASVEPTTEATEVAEMAVPVVSSSPASETESLKQTEDQSAVQAASVTETEHAEEAVASENVNPDEQGYWDANGNWNGYGWWNTDASGKAIYHYDSTYHSAPASQESQSNDQSADYQSSADQPQEYTAPEQTTAGSSSSIDAVAAAYNGQYAGVSCEGVAGQYLGVTYLIYTNVYQVSDPQPNDIIAYFDSGWNYKHTAVYLGEGKALHGSYNGAAQVASMYISQPNMVYFRMGGDTAYSRAIYDIAHANGGTAGWLDPLYR